MNGSGDNITRKPTKRRKEGARYEICVECGLDWNVSKQAEIDGRGYLCPRCRGKYRKQR